MDVVEDFESRPHTAGTSQVERDQEISGGTGGEVAKKPRQEFSGDKMPG